MKLAADAKPDRDDPIAAVSSVRAALLRRSSWAYPSRPKDTPRSEYPLRATPVTRVLRAFVTGAFATGCREDGDWHQRNEVEAWLSAFHGKTLRAEARLDPLSAGRHRKSDYDYDEDYDQE